MSATRDTNNTSATRVRHEQHECDTSVTRTTRVQHKCYTNDKGPTRVKNFAFHNETIGNIFHTLY